MENFKVSKNIRVTVEEVKNQDLNKSNLYVDADHLYSVMNYLDPYFCFPYFQRAVNTQALVAALWLLTMLDLCWVKMVTQKL